MDERTELVSKRTFMFTSRTEINAWERRTLLERIQLIALFVLVFILIIVSVTLTSQKLAAYVEGHSDCKTSFCVKAASNILHSINTSVDPCENFYLFACGSWIKDNVRVTGSISSLSKMNNKLLYRIYEILSQPSAANDPEHLKKAKALFNSCRNETHRASEGASVLLRDLDYFGGWPVLKGGSWNESSFDWIKVLHKMYRRGYNKDILVSVRMNIDVKDSKSLILLIDTADLGVDSRDVFISATSGNTRFSAYHTFLRKTTLLLGAELDTNSTEAELHEALNVEILLANLSTPIHIEAFQNIMTIGELNQQLPEVDWLRLVNGFLPTAVTEHEKVVVPNMAYLKAFTNFVTTLNVGGKRALANYMMYRAVLSAVIHLDKPFRDLYDEFQSALRGYEYNPDVWMTCSDITSYFFDHSLSSIYVKSYFQDARKHAGLDMTENIRHQLKVTMETATWMDFTTMQRALSKIDAMTVTVGYPEEILDDNAVNKLYANADVHGYLKYKDDLSQTDVHGYLKYKDDLSLESQGRNLLVANAYYSVQENSISIPVGILQADMFNEEGTSYLNYGSLGTVIGHELIHGFDNFGSTFDEEGNLNNWWKKETYEKFMKKTECFVKQYNSYVFEKLNVSVNGTKTLGENIADNGGIRQAYKAYHHWVSHNGYELPLPGLPYSEDQLFWISFAIKWCSETSPSQLLENISHDEHTPAMYRVIGIVSNNEDFARDFKCSSSAPMNPENKCVAWR
ncbi:neprilysin-11-like [Limulus polyphemus]|uniref:Neprilysin-11-like n=1 Tax=Limulus polyphemus TaxID=6850 RepID=A0ABM1S4I5_LIMPO|nr:neprilysin-11-like [Limulus polyphemus]